MGVSFQHLSRGMYVVFISVRWYGRYKYWMLPLPFSWKRFIYTNFKTGGCQKYLPKISVFLKIVSSRSLNQIGLISKLYELWLLDMKWTKLEWIISHWCSLSFYSPCTFQLPTVIIVSYAHSVSTSEIIFSMLTLKIHKALVLCPLVHRCACICVKVVRVSIYIIQIHHVKVYEVSILHSFLCCCCCCLRITSFHSIPFEPAAHRAYIKQTSTVRMRERDWSTRIRGFEPVQYKTVKFQFQSACKHINSFTIFTFFFDGMFAACCCFVCVCVCWCVTWCFCLSSKASLHYAYFHWKHFKTIHWIHSHHLDYWRSNSKRKKKKQKKYRHSTFVVGDVVSFVPNELQKKNNTAAKTQQEYWARNKRSREKKTKILFDQFGWSCFRLKRWWSTDRPTEYTHHTLNTKLSKTTNQNNMTKIVYCVSVRTYSIVWFTQWNRYNSGTIWPKLAPNFSFRFVVCFIYLFTATFNISIWWSNGCVDLVFKYNFWSVMCVCGVCCASCVWNFFLHYITIDVANTWVQHRFFEL